MSRFYNVDQVQEMRFYQLPKSLFNNIKYKGLSLGAKVAYSLLRDRQDLSIKNNWVDENGNIYSNYSVIALCEILEVSNKTAIKFKKELVKYGLIIDKRMGQGSKNRLYVLRPEHIENTVKCTSCTSKDVHSTTQEMYKIHTNDTDSKDTNISETINQEKKQNDRLNDIDNLKIKLKEKYGQAILEKSLQQLSIAVKKGTVVNNLYNYLDKVCKGIQGQLDIINGISNVDSKVTNNRKGGWGSNNIQTAAKYTNTQLEEKMLAKRNRYCKNQ